MFDKPRDEGLEQRGDKSENEPPYPENGLGYGQLFGMVNDAVFVHLIDDEGVPGRFIQVNDTACQRLGYTRQELLQLSPLDIGAGDNSPGADQIRKTLRTHGSALFETVHVTKDGQKLPVESNVRMFKDNGRRLVLSISRDISRRKRMAQALRASEDHYEQELLRVNRALRVLSETNQAIVRATDEESLLQNCCRLIVETGGYRMAWIGYAVPDKEKSVRPVAWAGYGKGYVETLKLTWADTPRGRGPTGAAIRTGKPVIAKNIPTDPNFKPWREQAFKQGYASSMALPLFVEGETIGSLNIYAREPDAFNGKERKRLLELAEDLSFGIGSLRTAISRQRAEEALRESEEKFRFLAENMADIVWTRDSDMRLTYVSPSVEKVLGFTTDERKNQALDEMLTPESSTRARLLFTKEMERENDDVAPDRSVTIELENYSKDGATVWLENNIKFIRNGKGAVKGLYGVSRNITERKQNEEQLEKYQENLENLVKERTWELSLEKERAESANRAKSDFLASMSHELRTPLNAVIGFSEVLADKNFGPLNKKQEKYVANIYSSGRHLLSLINDILDLSKVEAGKMALEVSNVPLEPVLRNSLTMVKEKAHKHNIRLELAVPPELSGLTIKADERKLKQILFNLLSNAVKFTPDGGSVRVSARMIPDSGIEISVADSGIGFSPGDRKRLFKEFEQIDSSYARRHKGTGLGLALTQKLVELHGGTIKAYSDGENKGSTFRFRLPGAPPEYAELETAHDPFDFSKIEKSENPPALVVEDDPYAAELLCGPLETAGFSAVVAADGEQALQMLKQFRPGVILLDILLPKMSGWEVLEAIKAGHETRDIPVMIVSVTEDHQLGFSPGGVEWFVKPVDRGALINALQRAKTKNGAACRVVLVIDDDASLVELTTTMLRSEGYGVLCALSGPEGLKKAVEKVPDVILLDLMMPEMTGFEVIEQLRSRQETEDIPILVYTSKDLSAGEREMLNRGACSVTAKPDGEKAMLEKLRQLLEISKE